MLSLRIRRAAAVLALAAASTLILPLDLHAARREGTRKEKRGTVQSIEQIPLLGRVISVIWEAAGLRIDDNGCVKCSREAVGVRIDDNG